MAEMAYGGEDHGEAEAVGGGGDFVVAHGAAGLDDGGDSVLGGFLDAVGEREEGVGGEYGSLQRQDGLHRADFDGIDAAHLPGAGADGLAGAGEYDGVGFNVLHDFPAEFERIPFGLRRASFGGDAGFGAVQPG